jgi:hypothetical protein
MKIIIEKDFSGWSDEHVAAWFARLVGQAPAAAQAQEAQRPELPAPAETTPEKPARRPRSDAGKPRGPHKNDAPQGATVAPPATAAQTPPAETPPAAPAPAPSTPQNGGELTIDDARDALGRISLTPNMGMQGCMDHLKEFGVDRITKLPAEKYADFIVAADAKVAKAKAAK